MREQVEVNKVTNRVTNALFIIYLAALCWILLLKLGVRFSYMGNRRVNLVPFYQPSLLTSENILNVVIFIPLGVYAGILFQQWTFCEKLLFVVSVSLVIEGLQYLLSVGAFDVTDIITNSLGGFIGLMIHYVTEKAFNNNVKAQKFINSIAATATVLMILMLVLLKMNMLPVRYQ